MFAFYTDERYFHFIPVILNLIQVVNLLKFFNELNKRSKIIVV